MTGTSEQELSEDADIEGLDAPSWLGGFLKGTLLGGILSAVGVISLSLGTPLPDHLPGVGRVEIVGGPAAPLVAAAPAASSAPDTTSASPGTGETAEGTDAKATAGTEAGGQAGAAADTLAAARGDTEQQAAAAAPSSTQVRTVARASQRAAQGTGQPAGQQQEGDRVTPAQPTAGASAQDSAQAPANQQGEATDRSSGSGADQEEAASTDTARPEMQGQTDQADGTGDTADPSQAGQTLGTATGTSGTDAASIEATQTAAQGTAADQDAPAAVTAEPEADDSPQQANSDASEPANGTADAQGDAAPGTDQGSPMVAALAPATGTAPQAEPEPARTISFSGAALTVNARDFDVAPEAPLLSIVLENAGNGTITPDMLSQMPMPLTVAIRPDGEASRAMGEAARAAGHEVLVQLPMSTGEENPARGALAIGAESIDLQVQTINHMALLDMAVGATTPDGARAASDKTVMEAVMGAIGQNGFAFVDIRGGITTLAARVAAEAGVPYVASNRFVPDGATEDQIYQMLETAAFQARRQGTNIVFITASPVALKGLIRWGIEKGRRPVWFAPISTVLARQKTG